MKHYKRKKLNIGIGNLLGLTVLTLVLMSLFSFQRTVSPQGTNQVHANLIHSRAHWYQSDIVTDDPILMTDRWHFFVTNHLGTGGDMEIVKFTACCEPAISWPEDPPYSEFSPCNGRDYGYEWNGPWLIAENTMFGPVGEGEEGTTEKPDVIVTRAVAPPILDSPEILQIVSV